MRRVPSCASTVVTPFATCRCVRFVSLGKWKAGRARPRFSLSLSLSHPRTTIAIPQHRVHHGIRHGISRQMGRKERETLFLFPFYPREGTPDGKEGGRGGSKGKPDPVRSGDGGGASVPLLHGGVPPLPLPPSGTTGGGPRRHTVHPPGREGGRGRSPPPPRSRPGRREPTFSSAASGFGIRVRKEGWSGRTQGWENERGGSSGVRRATFLFGSRSFLALSLRPSSFGSFPRNSIPRGSSVPRFVRSGFSDRSPLRTHEGDGPSDLPFRPPSSLPPLFSPSPSKRGVSIPVPPPPGGRSRGGGGGGRGLFASSLPPYSEGGWGRFGVRIGTRSGVGSVFLPSLPRWFPFLVRVRGTKGRKEGRRVEHPTSAVDIGDDVGTDT